MKDNLQNIILDFDGVIVDSYDLVFNIFKQKYKNITHQDFQDLFDTGINDGDKMGIAEGKKFTDWFFSEYNFRLNHQIHLFKEVSNHLEKLAEKYKLFIISSNSEKAMGEFLSRANLNLFHSILGYETSKSKTEKFKFLEQAQNINVKNSIFITDTLADIVEGKEAGYQILAETFGYHKRNRLKKGDPDFIVDSWQEILIVL